MESVKILKYNVNNGELVINFKNKGHLIKIVDSLQICEKIVDYHGGKIWVNSNEGNGSDFRFTIPKN